MDSTSQPGSTPPPIDPLPALQTSVVLLRKAKAGDRQALNDLIARYYERVRRLVRIRMSAQLRRSLESCDLAQETLRVAAGKLAAFEPRDHHAFIRWLAVIAQHQINDARAKFEAEKRDRGREVPLEASSSMELGYADSGPSPGSVAGDAELREIYDACVTQLPEEYREIILLKEFEDASWEEIRKATGAPTAHAAQQKFYRAQVKLAGILKLHLGS